GRSRVGGMAAGHEKGGEKVTRTAPGVESASDTRRRAKTRSRYATAPAGGSSAISTVAVSPARTKLASVNANWRGRPLARSYQATRTNASRTSGSLTSSVARNPARPSGTGTSPLSMPQARPPGTPPSGELHDPGRDLIGREIGPREASINVQRSRGSDHVKPVVPKALVALPEIDGARGADGPVEAEGAGHLLTFRVCDPHDEGSVRPRAKRGQHERRGRIDERHERARATIPQNGDRGRQPFANDPCRPCDIDLFVDRHDRVAVGATPDALRRRRRELGPGVAVALGKVASREEAHGAQQRDRDRAAIVKDRILAQTVDPDGQSLGRALHRHEVVHACLRGWWFDPSAANLKA